MPEPPSGAQYEILAGDRLATIVEVGGGVRVFRDGERDVLESYPLESVCDGGHGAVLAPWPNRLAEGRYSFDGAEHQLALSEPSRRNAIHGLLRWLPWQAREHESDRVLMAARVHPQPGYPFDLEVTIEYSLAGDGLTVTTCARNLGEHACPYGVGHHPYLAAGGARLDECALELPARTLITTDERQLPTGQKPVAGGPLDFLLERRIGDLTIDAPFTDLRRDGDGLAWTRLRSPDGGCAELWVEQGYGVLEVFTGDTLTPARRRTGLAVEPMTCPPNAFRSGELLVRLEPGESHRARWGVRLER
jgi:aldose 1-epimerase